MCVTIVHASFYIYLLNVLFIKFFFVFQLVDYLTADFLDEQYKGQRNIAGKVSTLGKMMATHGPLGEFLFDKKLLNGEL